MENNQKPDWFELAENDQPATRRFKGKVPAPKRNLALILAGVLVLPMGAGWALLSHEDQSANAVETLNLTQDSPVATSSTPTQTSNAITMPTASREDDNEFESEGEDEGDDDNYRAAPAFSVSTSAPVATPAATQSSQPAPVATVTKAPAVSAPTPKAPTAITPSGTSSTSKDLILPPTKKSGDDDEKEHKKKGEGKESKKSEDDEEDDD
jgi:hypothetical protein